MICRKIVLQCNAFDLSLYKDRCTDWGRPELPNKRWPPSSSTIPSTNENVPDHFGSVRRDFIGSKK
jgi:hypothetical protein